MTAIKTLNGLVNKKGEKVNFTGAGEATLKARVTALETAMPKKAPKSLPEILMFKSGDDYPIASRSTEISEINSLLSSVGMEVMEIRELCINDVSDDSHEYKLAAVYWTYDVDQEMILLYIFVGNTTYVAYLESTDGETVDEFPANWSVTVNVESHTHAMSEVTGLAAALASKLEAMYDLRIVYDSDATNYPVDTATETALNAFMSAAPVGTFVPVAVALYDGSHSDGVVPGMAKWTDSGDDIEVTVVMMNYQFVTGSQYQDPQDIQFTTWTRTPLGQSFFS